MRGKVLATATFGSGGALDKCRNTVSCRPPDVAGRHLFFYISTEDSRSTVVRSFMDD